jgi:hypothetical protein
MKSIAIFLGITLIGAIIWLNLPVNDRSSDTPISSTIKSYTQPPIDKYVIAKWKNEKNNNKVIEFFPDNTFSVTDGDKKIGGKWIKVSDNRIKAEMSFLGVTEIITFDDIVVKGDTMTTTVDGIRHTLSRIDNTK